jgi:alpha-beta hydrolase superfamily lysophospholipase
MEPVVSELVSVTGLKLHCEAWKPSGAPTAVIVFIHGYGDHVGRYAHGACEHVPHGVYARA